MGNSEVKYAGMLVVVMWLNCIFWSYLTFSGRKTASYKQVPSYYIKHKSQILQRTSRGLRFCAD